MVPTDMETNDFIAAQRLADSARYAIQKLEKVLYKTMTPDLAQDLKLDEISSDLARCLGRISEQQDKHPSTYLGFVWGLELGAGSAILMEFRLHRGFRVLLQLALYIVFV